MLKSFALAALIATALAQAGLHAQSGVAKTVKRQDTVKVKATVVAIDQATRSVTLRKDDGEEDTFTVGPEVTKFSQLKAGDKINATYHESLVMQLRKPGAPPPTAAAGDRPKGVPEGAIGRQHTASVTVKAVNMSAPYIVVVTADNRTLSRRVNDKNDLKGISPGDRIDITFTQALLVKVDSAK